jgi:hypothetical protein
MSADKCGVASCTNMTSFSRRDCLGQVHQACTQHSKYLEGWVRDVRAECESENRAAADYEGRAYGDD